MRYAPGTGWKPVSRRKVLAPIRALLPLIGFFLAGCGSLRSDESALNPAGIQAHRIGVLTWVFIWVCVVVYVVTMAFLLGGVFRGRRSPAVETGPEVTPDEKREKRLWTVVSGAIGLSVIVLFVLLIGDFATGRAVHKFSEQSGAIRIRLTAHQWWWDISYEDWPERFGERVQSNIVRTANEIHLPVDPEHPVPIEIELNSGDVIHSFWVPNLHGKKDIVPGHPSNIWLRADEPGTYWGECGEYCGYQHALMRLVVVAEPVDQFQNWLGAQRQPAPEPTTDAQRRGQEVFLGTPDKQGTCLMCHSVNGTLAFGRVGPDLTHVASRQVLAAGAIPNTKGHLGGWIADPQKIKPGVHMPQNNLTPVDLRDLLEYMETLR